MSYLPDANRYNSMEYRRCGNSGVKLPAVSLGLWHNFGHIDDLENGRNILRLAFDNGITHFDLAARESWGIPFKYLSVSKPCANEENAMQPTPSFSKTSSSPFSIHRSNIEYFG